MNDGLISMENVWYIDGESHSEVNANEFNGHFTTFRYFNTILKVLFEVKS